MKESQGRKRRLNTKLHLAVDALGMRVRIIIMQAIMADSTQTARLIGGLGADYLIADKGYDSDAIIKTAENQGMKTVIPPRKKQDRAKTLRRRFL